MLETAVAGCMDVTGVPHADVGSAHVANVGGEAFAGQVHLGAMLPGMHPDWRELPASRHEGACASGSLAVLAAMADIESGRYDVVLVVGVELMRNVPGAEAAALLASSSWRTREDFGGDLVWPSVFDRIADEYERRHGLDRRHLQWIAENAMTNARNSPQAQTRSWTVRPEDFLADDEVNPVVVGRTRRSDCGRVTDGASAIILCSGRYAEQWRHRHGGRDVAVISGWGHTTATMSLESKLEASRAESYVFPHVRRAVVEACRRAEIGGPGDLSVAEVHDCFTAAGYMSLDHLGIEPPGQVWRAIEDGRLAMGGALPINPSGGLMAHGHPVGATGVRMVLDVARQVTGQAGPTQVADARRGITLNIGGSAATAVSLVLQRAD
jgi:acetyl-CoA C-acetyltransferase